MREPDDAGSTPKDAAANDVNVVLDASQDANTKVDASSACTGDTLDANRNRLLESYFEFLKANATTPQTNGLSNTVTSALDVWQKLDPSSRAVFLTISARLQGSLLGKDGTSMLSHVMKIYRITGGQSATTSDPGSCGGGEYNRMIMSMDAELHDVQVTANADQGALQTNQKYDIADVIPSSFWRDSHDLGGPHAPFDLSDETNGGAPRGQTPIFSDRDITAPSNAPLGRQDLATLVDPYALEMDQDYDCVHNSNPLCTYTTYGQLCSPEAAELGVAVYTGSYGTGASYAPASCP